MRLKEELAGLKSRSLGIDSALGEVASKSRGKEQERTEFESAIAARCNTVFRRNARKFKNHPFATAEGEIESIVGDLELRRSRGCKSYQCAG